MFSSPQMSFHHVWGVFPKDITRYLWHLLFIHQRTLRAVCSVSVVTLWRQQSWEPFCRQRSEQTSKPWPCTCCCYSDERRKGRQIDIPLACADRAAVPHRGCVRVCVCACVLVCVCVCVCVCLRDEIECVSVNTKHCVQTWQRWCALPLSLISF